MRIDNPSLFEGSDFTNLTVDSGTSYPGSANIGELFFRTDLDKLYVYDGSSWLDTTSTASLGAANQINNSAKNTLTTATSSVPLAIGEDQVASGEQLIFDDESIQARVWNGAAWEADQLFLQPDGGLTTTGGAFTATGAVTGSNVITTTVSQSATASTGIRLTLSHPAVNVDDRQNSSNSILRFRNSNIDAFFTTSSEIGHFGTAELQVRANSSGNKTVSIRNAAGSENMAAFVADGAASLYYDSTLRFATVTTGAQVTGTVMDVAPGANSTASTRIYNTVGGIQTRVEATTGAGSIRQTSSTGTAEDIWINMVRDGGVALHHNNVAAFNTTTQGVEIVDPSGGVDPALRFVSTIGGTQLGQLQHFNNSLYLDNGVNAGNINIRTSNATEADRTSAVFSPTAQTFHYAGSAKLSTQTDGILIEGAANVSPSSGGAGQLRIQSSGYSGYIALDATGMYIGQNSSSRSTIIQADETNSIVCSPTAGVSLYYNGSVRLATTSAGATCTGAFTATGDITANSDLNLKENIEVIDNALDRVNQLTGYTFNIKSDEIKRRKAGVIAQEVEKVLPEVVYEDEDGVKSVAYGNMVGLLIEAMKEMSAQIETLKDEVEELKR